MILKHLMKFAFFAQAILFAGAAASQPKVEIGNTDTPEHPIPTLISPKINFERVYAPPKIVSGVPAAEIPLTKANLMPHNDGSQNSRCSTLDFLAIDSYILMLKMGLVSSKERYYDCDNLRITFTPTVIDSGPVTEIAESEMPEDEILRVNHLIDIMNIAPAANAARLH